MTPVGPAAGFALGCPARPTSGVNPATPSMSTVSDLHVRRVFPAEMDNLRDFMPGFLSSLASALKERLVTDWLPEPIAILENGTRSWFKLANRDSTCLRPRAVPVLRRSHVAPFPRLHSLIPHSFILCA